jgi:hypothetical protein
VEQARRDRRIRKRENGPIIQWPWRVLVSDLLLLNESQTPNGDAFLRYRATFGLGRSNIASVVECPSQQIVPWRGQRATIVSKWFLILVILLPCLVLLLEAGVPTNCPHVVLAGTTPVDH